MNDNKIRRLTVLGGIEGIDREGAVYKTSLNFIIGTKHKIYEEGTTDREEHPICSIEEVGNDVLIYVGTKEVVSLWQKIPKSKRTLIEYYVD